MTPSSRTASATEHVIGPAVSRVLEIGTMPACEYRLVVGRNPTHPHRAAGIRTEPPVSVPSPAGASRAATATPVPPLLPPGISRRSHGFRAGPNEPLLLVTPYASSWRLVLPSTIAPARSSASTMGAFRRGRWSF